MADLTIEYDDQPNEVVDKINKVLEEKHGLTLEWDEENCDVMGYDIVRRKDLR
jgi:hypothetical protein